MKFNMLLSKAFKLLFLFVSIITGVVSLVQASPIYGSSSYSRSIHQDNFKPEIRKFAESYFQLLPTDQRFTAYDIPSQLKSEYENCLNKAQDRLNSRAWDRGVQSLDYTEIESVTTQEIDKFVKTMNSIVLKSKLDEKINDVICDLIHKNDMVKGDIKKYSESEYNSRYYKVRDNLSDVMSYDGRSYVRISEVEKTVKDEFTVLIKRIKGQVGSSNSWTSQSSKHKDTHTDKDAAAGGDAWQAFWNWLTGKFSDATVTSPAPSAPPYDYVGEKCSICLENIKSHERLGYLDCGHCFHESCIQESLKRYAHKCPLCGTHTDSIAYTVVVPFQHKS